MKVSNQLIEYSEDVKEYQGRYPYFYLGLVLCMLLLFSRLWYLQILKGKELKKFSEQNQIKEEKIQALRGMFFDKDGQILVDNQGIQNVVLTPQYITNLKKAADSLSIILKIPAEEIIKKVNTSKIQNGVFKPVRIKENMNPDERIAVELLVIDTPGLSVEEGNKRNYLLGENGAQIYGYTAEISKNELLQVNQSRGANNKLKAGDVLGKTGLEKRWDGEIRGVDGSRFVEVDAKGREVGYGENLGISGYPDTNDFLPGKNLTLTIDKDLQDAAYKSYKAHDRIGSAVALDPNTGEILMMVNLPSFDPNHFSTGIPPEIWSALVNDPFKPLRNKTIQDPAAPGSTFKAIVALAALQEKIITPKSTFFCPGFLYFGGRPYHCHIKNGHGHVNVVQALERSCDVFFYQVGLALGIDRIAKYARLLGLGTKTGISLDNEKSGLIPDTIWKKENVGEEWQAGENLSNAIGQGFILATPLQMALAYGAIGNFGKAYKPHLVKKMHNVDNNEVTDYSPELLFDASVPKKPGGPFISKETFELVKEGLHQVFNGTRGTAQNYKIPGLDVSGKTGTVQLFQFTKDTVYAKCEAKPFKQRNHGWLLAYAPKDDPKIVVAVHTEHSCHGTSSGPIVKDILLNYFHKHYPQMLEAFDKKVGTQKIEVQAPAAEGDE